MAPLFEILFDGFNNRCITDFYFEKIKSMFCAENLKLDHNQKIGSLPVLRPFFLATASIVRDLKRDLIRRPAP